MIKEFKKALRKIYKIIFEKGFFYHYIQQYITKIKTRELLSTLERKLFCLIHKQKNSNINCIDNVNAELLKKRGVTNSFELQSLNENKQEIVDYFYNNKIFLDKDPKTTFKLDEIDEKIKVGYYKPEVTANCPFIFDIVNDEIILNILNSYFNSPYKLDYATTWWSFKNQNFVSEKTQYFHRDLDSLNFIKFFIYLTDVDDNSGPNQYIKYSHKKNFGYEVSRKPIKDKDFEKTVGNNLFTFVGKSGSVIAANTFGLHRGKTPVSSDRLMLVLSYSIVKTFYGPSKSFLNLNDLKIKNKNINKYINQTYIL